MTKQDVCKMFGCTMEQLNQQYKANAETLERMRNKAIKTGKKVNGFTGEQLDNYTQKYKAISNA